MEMLGHMQFCLVLWGQQSAVATPIKLFLFYILLSTTLPKCFQEGLSPRHLTSVQTAGHWSKATWAAGIHCLYLPSIGTIDTNAVPTFYVCSGDLNSDTYTNVAGSWLTEPSLSHCFCIPVYSRWRVDSATPLLISTSHQNIAIVMLMGVELASCGIKVAFNNSWWLSACFRFLLVA